MSLRIVFMGAGKLASPVFDALCRSHHSVVGLVTQPDKTGKGHHHHINPLKVLAESLSIPVLQPAKLRLPEAVAELQKLQADLFVVAAYGQILSKDVLALPPRGTINVHASLLPKYRGATPIHAAIMNGDDYAGITMIELVQALDAGPMLGHVSIPIEPKETTGELEERLAVLAVPLALQVIDQIDAGTAARVEQDHKTATHVGKLSKADSPIDWSQPAQVIERKIRAFQPWPGATALLQTPNKPSQRLLLLEAKVVEQSSHGTPGDILFADPRTIIVQTGTTGLSLQRLQPESKRAMTVSEFQCGRKVVTGDRFEGI